MRRLEEEPVKMYTYKWRRSAKVVAYLDLIFRSMALMLAILLAIEAGVAPYWIRMAKVVFKEIGPVINKKYWEDTVSFLTFLNDFEDALVHIWILVGIILLRTIVELWMAIELLNATESGRDPARAYKRAQIWQNVASINFIIDLIFSIVMGYYIFIITSSLALLFSYIISAVIAYLIRGLFIFVVWEFMKELKDASYMVPNPTRRVASDKTPKEINEIFV